MPSLRLGKTKRAKKQQIGRRSRAKNPVNNNKKKTSTWQQNKSKTKQKTEGESRKQRHMPKRGKINKQDQHDNVQTPKIRKRTYAAHFWPNRNNNTCKVLQNLQKSINKNRVKVEIIDYACADGKTYKHAYSKSKQRANTQLSLTLTAQTGLPPAPRNQSIKSAKDFLKQKIDQSDSGSYYS